MGLADRSVLFLVSYRSPLTCATTTGYFLRAYLIFDTKVGAGKEVRRTFLRLLPLPPRSALAHAFAHACASALLPNLRPSERALIIRPAEQDPAATYHHIYSTLTTHRSHVRDDAWAGLPELTNENASYCHDSCDTQAWSSSTILDVLDDINARESL